MSERPANILELQSTSAMLATRKFVDIARKAAATWQSMTESALLRDILLFPYKRGCVFAPRCLLSWNLIHSTQRWEGQLGPDSRYSECELGLLDLRLFALCCIRGVSWNVDSSAFNQEKLCPSVLVQGGYDVTATGDFTKGAHCSKVL